MSIDERLDKLAERHEALTQSLEILTHDINTMREQAAEQDRRVAALRQETVKHHLAVMHAIQAYMDAMDPNASN